MISCIPALSCILLGYLTWHYLCVYFGILAGMAKNGESVIMGSDMEKYLRHVDTIIAFGTNPHKDGTKNHGIFESVRGSTSIGEAKKRGATLWELREWTKNGSIN